MSTDMSDLGIKIFPGNIKNNSNKVHRWVTVCYTPENLG
jgi:hypothetical protein